MRVVVRKNLGLMLVVSLIVVLGGLALMMRRTDAAVVVPSGYDSFTTPNDAQTYDDFSTHPIPANFFGDGSLQYAGQLALKGGPPVDSTRFGSADTVIQRVSSVTVPGSTSLSVTGLSFLSASPITVQYTDGHSESWNVTVNASPTGSSGGSMYFNSDGTFSSNLSIYPIYTFTNAGHPTKTLDTGSGGGSAPITLSSSNGTWSQSGSVTVINPGSESAQLQSHHVQPAPSPTPIPCQTPVPMQSTSRTAATTQATCIAQ